MNFLITGANGQLGKSFINFFNTHSVKFTALDKNELDIANTHKVEEVLKKIHFDVLINTAAYTNVDLAEKESKLAHEVNHIGPCNLAEYCKQSDRLLVHFSTDYVFDGQSDISYKPHDTKSPINVYGESKLLGELGIAKSGCKYLIFRTAWVFSEHSNNFLKTILDLANKKDELDIICDQVGSPTYAPHIVECVFHILKHKKNPKKSIYHIAGYPEVSWYEFAKEILKYANEVNLIAIIPKLNSVSATSYQQIAARPNYSILNSTDLQHEFGIKKNLWKEGIRSAIHSIIES
ncbi:dTDP-4-dehydrorhamnose reductase [Gammaproteobacteria bacterium]|jgi:dTDP-4-dehydrorhamnose reductase|nr:dTDP-4-dehydrorhamnose reductase [Gammaproteobacteria bacterium]MDC0129001.1 dTDP-4-dehydrorhamnose reductase [Gammaproteobacteria bacterium]